MASRPARRCQKCKAVVRGVCPTCDKQKREQFDNARRHDEQRIANKKVYNAKQWKIVREEVYARDEGICQLCKRYCPPHEYHCDHKIELGIWKGDAFDVGNLQVAHRVCHSGKTMRESVSRNENGL